MFNAEMIKWNLETDKDLIEIDRRLGEVLTQHIQTLPEIQKFGTGYMGRMKIVNIEITNEDDLGGLDEVGFKTYLTNPEVNVNIPVIWNKDKVEGEVSNG
jgi:hypothetical protein